MKKLLLLVLIAVVIGACNQSGKETATEADSLVASGKDSAAFDNSIVYQTLDGTPEDKAKEMIAAFQKTQGTDKYDENISFLIERKKLDSIYNVLLREKKAQTAAGKKYTTDGIRFYFGKDGSKLKLILVSTTDSIPFPGNMAEKMHHDYYGHIKNDLTNALLEVKSENKDESKQKLFTKVNSNDSELDATCSESIRYGWMTVGFAKMMVSDFKGMVKKTKAVWFGLDRFENILKESKCQGLRIYLAGYPEHDISTLVLTTSDKDSVDYFDCKSDKKSIKKFGPPENNGSLCPINCN